MHRIVLKGTNGSRTRSHYSRSKPFNNRHTRTLFIQPVSTPKTDFFRFEIEHTSTKSRARVGVIHTPHGKIETPGFVPVATNGTLKYVTFEQSSKVGTQLMFCNTYHTMVHPGPDVIEKAGGIHKFINYHNPIITDSGGFQVFSLADNSQLPAELKGNFQKKYTGSLVLKISEEGVLFRSYRDGELIMLTPESSVQAQKKIGGDLIIPLDWLLPNCVDTKTLADALAVTHKWEIRSLREHLKNIKNQAMYGVIHGGTDLELRKQSAKLLLSLPFQGMAIGGSFGQNRSEMYCLLRSLSPYLPSHLPVHLLGIGDLESITEGVQCGIDTFDSSLPTRYGRHGTLLSDQGVIKLRRTYYKDKVNEPLFQDSNFSESLGSYSLAALHHFLKQGEPVAATLGTLYNLYYMMKFMKQLREKIRNNEI